MNIPCVKICGLTNPREADFLNQAGADYAGFVFYEKSRRNVSAQQAKEIQDRLSPHIQRVAVTVSPDIRLYEQIETLGFDILQVHGSLREEILEKSSLPIWRACNMRETGDLEQLEHHHKITAYVVDGGNAGSGKTFDWKSCQRVEDWKEKYFHKKAFVLAGGLCSRNVQEGIRIFRPDVVDVSSGVEKISERFKIVEKDKKLIFDFIKEVKMSEENEHG